MHRAQSLREPVLSYVYKSYEHTTFPNFDGGLFGHYLLALLIPLISIVGVIIVMIFLIASSFILLTKQRHIEVSKVAIEKIKKKNQNAYGNLKERYKVNKINKDAKPRIIVEIKAVKAAELSQSQINVKVVTDLPEISSNTNEQ